MKENKTDHSIIRDEEYENLSSLKLNGKILDIGGSQKSGYHSLFGGEHMITTVNLDPGYGCDLVFDIQKKFPLDDESFDHVLCFNVLEHVYGVHNVILETYRVMKGGGSAVFATPFIFHIHGSPDDYFRYTKSALQKLFSESGFKDIQIKEMGFGLFSVIFQTIEPALPRSLRGRLKYVFILIDKFLLRFVGKYKKLAERIPLGYFIVATK